MFNGIIFNQGLVKKITKRKKGINLFLKSDLKFSKTFFVFFKFLLNFFEFKKKFLKKLFLFNIYFFLICFNIDSSTDFDDVDVEGVLSSIACFFNFSSIEVWLLATPDSPGSGKFSNSGGKISGSFFLIINYLYKSVPMFLVCILTTTESLKNLSKNSRVLSPIPLTSLGFSLPGVISSL